MNLNSIGPSFAGLYIKTASELKGKEDGVNIVDTNYIYRPFKDETADEAQAAIKKYNGKTIESYNNDSDYPYQVEKLTVKHGGSLNLTTAEYEKSMADICEPTSAFDSKILVG